MQSLKIKFNSALLKRDKEQCIGLILEFLEKDNISIPNLYELILAPSLYDIASNEKEQDLSIWEEHVQSSIVRTCLEVCYPHVIKKASPSTHRALVFCQEEEYHELGARMTTDFLTLLGFDATFIGANTPPEEAIEAVKSIQPKLIAISVTNFFHLTKLGALIEELRNVQVQSPFKIMVGGYAISHTPDAKLKIKSDYFAECYEDIVRIKEELK